MLSTTLQARSTYISHKLKFVWRTSYTIQLNLKFMHTHEYMFTVSKSLKILRAHALLHACLAYAQLPINTHNIQVMNVISLHLVCHTTQVVYRYSSYVSLSTLLPNSRDQQGKLWLPRKQKWLKFEQSYNNIFFKYKP